MCLSVAHIRSYSGPYFPVFRLNTDQNNSEYRHFARINIYRRKRHLNYEFMFYDHRFFQTFVLDGGQNKF